MFDRDNWQEVFNTIRKHKLRTLLTALGVWLDSRSPASFSWALTMLILGMALGCFNAWRWVSRERKVIEEELMEGCVDDDAEEKGDEEKGTRG